MKGCVGCLLAMLTMYELKRILMAGHGSPTLCTEAQVELEK